MIAKPRLKLTNGGQSIKEQIERQAEHEPIKKKPVTPLEAPVLALPHTPIYKMHRYYARRPHNVFAKLIQHYTSAGDVVLDPFCGGGVTVVESLRLRRRVVGVDLNPLATWVTRIEVSPIDQEPLTKEFERWVADLEPQITSMFLATCGRCGKKGTAEWYEWSNVVECEDCGKKVVLGQAKKIAGGKYECMHCEERFSADRMKRLPDQMLSVKVNCRHCDHTEIRDALPGDRRLASKFEDDFKSTVRREKLEIPNDDFPDANSVRENNLFKKGFHKFSDYFTSRNLIANGRLKKWLMNEKIDTAVRDHLFHVFSASLRYTNKMVFRSEGWQGGQPIEWAGHIYWPPEVYDEINPMEAIRKKFETLVAGKKDQSETIDDFVRFGTRRQKSDSIDPAKTCWLLTQSSHKLPLPDHSVDAVITDPPFGGNVQYAELSDFYVVWLKEHLGLKGIIDTTHEAIETRHEGFEGAKDRSFYEDMLFKVFSECRRVLKPNGWMVMTFHNRDIGVWMALNRAAIRAGFRLPSEDISSNRGMVYQPPIQNYTQTIHQKRAGSMLGDFILSFQPAASQTPMGLREALNKSEEDALVSKARELIQYHGGADETTLMTGLIPFLSEKGLLARLAKYDFRPLFDGNFKFVKAEKKWYTPEMIGDDLKPIRTFEYVPAQLQTELIVKDLLDEVGRAPLDDILIGIYSRLVNSHRPQMETIEGVLSRCCRPVKVKGSKRPYFEWKPDVQTQLHKQMARARQTQMFDAAPQRGHDDIIRYIAGVAMESGYTVQIGATERKKDKTMRDISLDLSGSDFGLPSGVFRILKEIDLLVVRGNVLLAAFEIVISMGTLIAALARFENLFTVAPNLTIRAVIVCNPADVELARRQLDTPANKKSGLARKVVIRGLDSVTKESLTEILESVS